jgi:hypothetical protein
MRLLTTILLLFVTATPLAAAPPVAFTSTCRQTVRDQVTTINEAMGSAPLPMPPPENQVAPAKPALERR